MTLWGEAGVVVRNLVVEAMADIERASGGGPSLDQVLLGILKLSSEGFIITDSRCRILMFSPSAEVIFGFRHEELLGHSIELLIPHRFHAAHATNVERFAASTHESLVMGERNEIIGRRKNGEEFVAEASISKLATPQGLFFTVILRDATERHEARRAMIDALRAAEAANAAKGSFLATMSHEIRTPLNGILGMAQAMSSAGLSELQRDQLDVIRKSGEGLLAILNDVLDLAKIESGKVELESIDFDLQSVVTGAYAAFTAIANKKGLSFGLVLQETEGSYRGDPNRIRQILSNLISNALKFTSVGEVRMSARYADGKLRVAIADTGVGIDPKALSRLFSPFVQGDSSTTRRHGGTGLGLAICRQIAELMGGSVSVESRIGDGSTFTFEIPLEKLQNRTQTPVEEPDVVSDAAEELPPLRVLAAEDNATNRFVLKTILNQIGIQPVFAEDGEQAVETWEKDEFDIILMDVQMPTLSGPEATRIIREREAALGRPPTPIVALTANAMAHQLDGYRAAGMNYVLTKPLNVAQLIAVLSETAVALSNSAKESRPA